VLPSSCGKKTNEKSEAILSAPDIFAVFGAHVRIFRLHFPGAGVHISPFFKIPRTVDTVLFEIAETKSLLQDWLVHTPAYASEKRNLIFKLNRLQREMTSLGSKRYGADSGSSSKRQRLTGRYVARRPVYTRMETVQSIPVQNLARTGGQIAAKANQKYFDVTKAATTVAAAGTIMSDSLNAMAQGAAETQRIGNRIKLTSVHLRGKVILPPSALTAVEDTVRILILLDRQANGAAPAVTDVLTTADYRAFNNMNNKGRFQTLVDETIDLCYQTGVNATPAYAAVSKSFMMNKKGLGISLMYSTSTPGIADVRTNNIVVLAISSGGVATLEYIARIRYDDV